MLLSSDDRRIWSLIGGMVVLFVLFIPFSRLAFDVNYDYTLRTVALGGAVLGIVSGALGCFAVLRRQSLMGDALSHAALPGVGIAFLVAGRELSILLIGAGIASWLAVYFIYAVTRTTRIKQDAAMGVVLAAWFAFGIALLAYIQARPDASQAGLDSFIFGQAAAIVRRDVELISGVGLACFMLLGFFWKELKLITFDMEFAQANGYPVRFLDMVLSTMIVVAIVLGLQLAGVILMVGLLIAPGVAARQWTQKLDQMVVLAGVFGAFSGSVGAIISAVDVNIPTGPMIIVVASVIVFLSICFAPGRGLVWTWLQQREDRRQFAAQNILRDMYRYALGHSTDPYYPTPDTFLSGIRGSIARVGLKQLEYDGDIIRQNNQWVLTASGVRKAQADVRNQQLWDAYRHYQDELALPLIKEDRQQDIARTLPAEAVARLESVLEDAS